MANIVGIGIDIENVSRFAEKSYLKNKRFYENIFTDKEIKYCLSKVNPYQHLAARFCAKEAVIKALEISIDLKKIEVLKEGNVPKIKVEGFSDFNIKVSLSHTENYAVASVIIQQRK